MRIAYIDMQNIKLWIRELWWELDRNRLYVYLIDHYHLDEIGLYVWYMMEKMDEYDGLKTIGYRIYYKSTHQRWWRVKWNIDTLLSHIATKHVDFGIVDFAILLSGDGDFDVIAKYWRRSGIWLRWIVPNEYKLSSLITSFVQPNELIYCSTLQHKIQKTT